MPDWWNEEIRGAQMRASAREIVAFAGMDGLRGNDEFQAFVLKGLQDAYDLGRRESISDEAPGVANAG